MRLTQMRTLAYLAWMAMLPQPVCTRFGRICEYFSIRIAVSLQCLCFHPIVMYGIIAQDYAVTWVGEFFQVMQIFHVNCFMPECKIDKIVETERNFMRDLIPESAQHRVITTGNHGDISLHQSRLIKIYVDLQQLILRCRLRFVFPTSSSICQRIP